MRNHVAFTPTIPLPGPFSYLGEKYPTSSFLGGQPPPAMCSALESVSGELVELCSHGGVVAGEFLNGDVTGLVVG